MSPYLKGYCSLCGMECDGRVIVLWYNTYSGEPITSCEYRCPKSRWWNHHRSTRFWNNGPVLEEHKTGEGTMMNLPQVKQRKKGPKVKCLCGYKGTADELIVEGDDPELCPRCNQPSWEFA